MTRVWELDKSFIRKKLKKIESALKNPLASKNEIRILLEDADVLASFLDGDFENNYDCDDIEEYLPKDKEKLKQFILNKMQKQYETLGRDFIEWIFDLRDADVFQNLDFTPATSMSLDEQAALMLETYKDNSPEYFALVKKILDDKKKYQFQQIDILDMPSYTIQTRIAGISFILINPNHSPWTLMHEVQHIIEQTLGYKKIKYYSELGPQYIEPFFLDKLYDKTGRVSYGDYQDRIDDANFFLERLCPYFQVMLAFADKNFEMSTEEFYQAFEENIDLEDSDADTYIRRVVASSDLEEDMTYFFSFIKAIELRDRTIKASGNFYDTLRPYCKRKTFDRRAPYKGIELLDNYVQEIHQKVKK